MLVEGNPLEDIANTRQIAGMMVQGRYYSRADLDLMLDAVVRDCEAVKATQTIVRIAFPVVVALLLVALHLAIRGVSWFCPDREPAGPFLRARKTYPGRIEGREMTAASPAWTDTPMERSGGKSVRLHTSTGCAALL